MDHVSALSSLSTARRLEAELQQLEGVVQAARHKRESKRDNEKRLTKELTTLQASLKQEQSKTKKLEKQYSSVVLHHRDPVVSYLSRLLNPPEPEPSTSQVALEIPSASTPQPWDLTTMALSSFIHQPEPYSEFGIPLSSSRPMPSPQIRDTSTVCDTSPPARSASTPLLYFRKEQMQGNRVCAIAEPSRPDVLANPLPMIRSSVFAIHEYGLGVGETRNSPKKAPTQQEPAPARTVLSDLNTVQGREADKENFSGAPIPKRRSLRLKNSSSLPAFHHKHRKGENGTRVNQSYDRKTPLP